MINTNSEVVEKMSSSDSDNSHTSWEELSVDSESFSEGGSSPASSEGSNSEAEEDVEVVRGAEPYRFEPLAPARARQDSDHEAASVAGDDDPVPPANIARLNNTDW